MKAKIKSAVKLVMTLDEAKSLSSYLGGTTTNLIIQMGYTYEEATEMNDVIDDVYNVLVDSIESVK